MKKLAGIIVPFILLCCESRAAELPTQAAKWEILYHAIGAAGSPMLVPYAGPFVRKPGAKAIAECERLMLTKCIAMKKRR